MYCVYYEVASVRHEEGACSGITGVARLSIGALNIKNEEDEPRDDPSRQVLEYRPGSGYNVKMKEAL